MPESIRVRPQEGREKSAARPAPREDKADGKSALAQIAAMPVTGSPSIRAAPCDHQMPTRQPSPRGSRTGCPRMPRTVQGRLLHSKVQKFKTMYATLRFMHEATLDDVAMWPTACPLEGVWTAAEGARIAAWRRKR